MKFIQLNGKKALLRLLINLSIYSVIASAIYGVMKSHNILLPGDTQIMLMLVYAFGLIWFLVFFFGGWYEYRISRKLLTSIATLNIFDNNNCYNGYLEKASRIFYTRSCLYGKVDGYPLIVSFNLAKDKFQTSTLDFEVITIKFNHPHKELISITVDWLRRYQPISDAKKEVYSLIENLKSNQ